MGTLGWSLRCVVLMNSQSFAFYRLNPGTERAPSEGTSAAKMQLFLVIL